MEINKEREAFEAWYEQHYNGRQIACDYVEEDNSYSVGYANAIWVGWQAAKKQVTPEGFVLVPKVLPSEINDQVWDDYLTPQCVVNEDGFSFISCEDFDLNALYQTLLKAQEQSHD